MPPRSDFPWPTERRDFEAADLRYCDFKGIVMEAGEPGFTFHRANLRGSSFRDCVLRSSGFNRADVSECEARDVALIDCSFDYFELQNSRVERLEMRDGHAKDGAILQSQVVESRFIRTDWTASNIHNNLFESCTFDGINLARASVHHNHYYKCHFKDCDLADQTFVNCIFAECTFENVRMDVDVVRTSAGLSARELRQVTLVWNGKDVPAGKVASVLHGLFVEHRDLGEIVEASTLAAALGRTDLLEEVLGAFQVTLEAPGARAGSDQWVNLSRSLMFWAQHGLLDPYWIIWVFHALVTHMKRVQGAGGFPDYQLIEAATSLAGTVQSHQTTMAREAFDLLPPGGLLDPIQFSIQVRDDLDPAAVVAFLDRVDVTLAKQVPPAFRRGGRLLQLAYRGARRGSLFLDFQSYAMGAAALIVALNQAKGLARDLHAETKKGRALLTQASAFVDGTVPGMSAPAAGGENTSLAMVPSPSPLPLVAAKEGAALATPAAVQAVAERNLGITVTANIVLPPDLRAEAREIVLSFEVRR